VLTRRFQQLRQGRLGANTDLMEDDGYAILGRELGNSLISVLLQHVEDNKSLEIHITKGIRNAVSQPPSTTRDTGIRY
jgi:hypothetical protein